MRGGSRADRLVDLIVALQRRIEDLERQLGGDSSPKISEPFSVEAEERRQEREERSGGSESGGLGVGE